MTVQSFGSFDEMMASIDAARARAVAAMTDDDRRLCVEAADRTVWFVKAQEFPDGVLVIFGHTWTDADHKVALKRYFESSEPADVREAESELAHYREQRRDGYLMTTAYSVGCVQGESGDSHASTMVEVDEETFEEARALGWEPVGERFLRVVPQLAARVHR